MTTPTLASQRNNSKKPTTQTDMSASTAARCGVSPRGATIATIVLGITVVALVAVMALTRPDSRLFNIEFLLLVLSASLLVTIWIAQLLSAKSVTKLKGQFGDFTVDLAGTVGIFFAVAAGVLYAYHTLQNQWWSDVGITDPDHLKRVLEEHQYIINQLGDNKDKLNQVGNAMKRFANEERLRNRIIGQYCYFVKDKMYEKNGWLFGRLSIVPRHELPLLRLRGRRKSIHFQSERLALTNEGIFYDWTAENKHLLDSQPVIGVATLKFTTYSDTDNGAHVEEMSGFYTDFNQATGRVLLVRNRGDSRDSGLTYCELVAAKKKLRKATQPDLEDSIVEQGET